MAGRQPVALDPRCVVPAELAGRQVLTELELGRQPVALGRRLGTTRPPAAGRRLGPAGMLQRSIGVWGGRALRGALASGGYANKIFLYNKLPT